MKLASIVAGAVVAVAAASARGAVNVQQNSDGTFYTGVLVNGPVSKKYNIVFVGDGFTSTPADQTKFNSAVDTAVAALKGRHPYSTQICALNIWRVNVVSAQAGVDHPMQSVFKNTELDCRYGNTANGEAERCITSDSPAKCFEAAAYAPAADAVFVLVNDTEWGGCSGSLVFSSVASGFSGIITHELGHKIGALADEYECYICDGSDSNTVYTGPEPDNVDLTKEKTNPPLKWGDLVLPGTPLPTTVDSPPGVVGAWEGGGYAAKGIYRPQLDCQMRDTGAAFCAVCDRQMDHVMGARCTCDRFPWACIDLQQFVACEPPCIDPEWWFSGDCIECGDMRLIDEMELVIDGIETGAEVSVSDSAGTVVARGVRGESGLVALKFQADRSARYRLRITGAKGTKQARSFRTTLTRNGVQSALPASVLETTGRQ